MAQPELRRRVEQRPASIEEAIRRLVRNGEASLHGERLYFVKSPYL